jgi:tetratricopeptide (TPR) repeat protein
LFVDRAKATRPDFALDSTNVTHVAEIVSRLDGLPLAIELAAARVRLLSVEAIRERLTSRLGLLTGGARDLPERQRTLRNAIEWSYDLLDAQHRQLFERLGVFAGGFALEQAEEVCGSNLDLDILDGLATLVDQSLLKPHEAPGHARFLMLETIREYADERLNARPEAPDVRRRHADAFLRLAETAAPEYLRKQSRRWLDRSDADHDNFRAAISWAIDVGQAEIAQCLTGALWRFWQMRGYLKEGRERVEAALVLHGGSVYSRLRAHEAAGGLAYWQAETGASLKHYEQALTLAREIGDPALTAQAIYNLASSTSLQEEVARGLELLAEGLTLADQLGDRELLGRLHWGKGGAYYLANTKDLGAALTEYQTAAEFLAGTAASFDIGWTERMLATVLLRLGRVDEAEGHIRTSLNTFVEAGDLSALPLHLADFVQLALARGEDERAILLAGAAGELQNVSGTRLLDIFPNEIGGLEEAIDRVGRERAEKVAAEGRALSVNQILDLVADH